MAVDSITDDRWDAEVLKSQIPVLVDFWAPWCGPCRAIAPIVDELSGEYAGKVKMFKMNTDENQSVPSKLGISGIPTLMVFKGGQLVDRLVGAAPKATIKTMIDRQAS